MKKPRRRRDFSMVYYVAELLKSQSVKSEVYALSASEVIFLALLGVIFSARAESDIAPSEQ